ncbi:MAG: hypothetical protein KAI66_13030 [Lentisphaeria bacterium]|nr:hypothetical protein [Lentisphaeria bacterium]
MRRAFSLIELVLGLGVLAFGIASVAALLSRSLSTNRVSIGETHTATHGDQFLHFYSARMRSGDESSDNWSVWGTSLSSTKADAAVEGSVSGEYSESPGDDLYATESTTDWYPWYTDSLVTYEKSSMHPALHRITQRNAQGDVEYTAVCRVWHSSVILYNYSSGSWSTETLAYHEAMVLNLEISWPSQLPYARRRKSLFQLEVYNRS